MLKLKRTVSLLLCFLLCFPCGAFGSPAEGSIAETENSDIEIAIALGVLGEDADKRYDESISRGEFFAGLSAIMGAESFTGTSPFTDISPEHPYFSGVCSASSLGLITGYGDGTVRPDESIDVRTAVRLLTYVVGWKESISAGMKVERAASDSGICNYAEAASANILTVEKAAKLFVNTGLAYSIELGAIGKNNDYVYSSETVFSKYLDICKVEGIVTASAASGLNSGYSAAGEGSVVIGGRVFFDNAAQAGKLLGMSVIAYCTEESAENPNRVIYAYADKRKNENLIISADEEPVYSGGVLYYTEKDKGKRKEQINISSCDFLYNGKNVLAPSDGMLSPESGFVSLIDNNNDGKWDVINVKEYRTVVVETVNEFEEKIIAKSGEVIDIKKADFFEMNSETGEQAYLVELGEWDVLAVCESLDKSVLEISVAEKILIGTLEGYRGGSHPSVDIDGEEYELSDYAFTHQWNELKASLSKRALFCFDINGKIACADFNPFSKDKYGYVLDWGTGSGLKTIVQVKILNDKGEIEISDLAEKIYLDGKRETLKTVYDWVKDGNEQSFIAEIPQIIVYQKNEAGEIYSIDTAYTVDMAGNISGNAIGEDEDAERSLHLFYDCYTITDGAITEDGNQSSLIYSAKGSKFVQHGPLNPNNSKMTVGKTYGLVLPFEAGTKIFVVPADGSEDEELYRVTTVDEFADETDDNSFFCRAFKRLAESPVAEAMLVFESDPKVINKKSAPIVVSGGIRTGISEDGEEFNLFNAYSESGEQTYTTKDTTVLSGLSIKVGDIIRVKTDGYGIVTGCEKVYSRGAGHIEDYDSDDDTDDPYCNNWTIRAAYRIRLANVYKVISGGYFVSTTEPLAVQGTYTPDYRYETRPVSDYLILVYDSETEEVRTGSSADLTGFVNSGGTDWSKIFTYDRTGTGRIMVIYK